MIVVVRFKVAMIQSRMTMMRVTMVRVTMVRVTNGSKRHELTRVGTEDHLLFLRMTGHENRRRCLLSRYNQAVVNTLWLLDHWMTWR